MKLLKTKKFGGEKELVAFVLVELIEKQDIFTITQYGGFYTLFYYQ